MQAINNNYKNSRLTRQTAPVAYSFDSLGYDVSKERYIEKLELFFDFIGLEGNSLEEKGLTFLAKAKEEVNNDDSKKINPYWIEDSIQDFLTHHKQRFKKGEIGANTLEMYYWPIKKFCDAHKRTLASDIEWKRLEKILPDAPSYSNDRCPTVQEIRKVIKNPNRRVKPVVLVMCSSGIRLRSWLYLKWKHVIPITNAYYLHCRKQEEDEKKEKGLPYNSNITITADDETKIIAAKLIAYDTKNRKEYFSFITPEAYYALKEWMDYRRDVQHEGVNGESWLVINEKISFATAPKRLEYTGLKRMRYRAPKKEGLRSDLPEGKRRYEWKESHGYLKFFETYAGTVMHPYNVKLLISHELGVEASYWKPTELQLLEDYLLAVPKLTINNYDFDKSVLHKEIAELKEKSEQQNKEKEKADEETKKELEQMRELQKQQAEQLAATSTRLEQMSQRYTKAFEIIPTLNYGDAHKFVSELLRGLPGQRAYEERQRKKKAENILYGD